MSADTTYPWLTNLRQNPDVVDAEVLPVAAQQLVVLVVPKGFRVGPEIRQNVLDAAGRLELPLVVVPTATMPRHADGTLDRTAAGETYLASGYTFTYQAPRTPEEAAVCGLVAELLADSLPGVAISVTDDLAALGGDSLTALELSERIQHTEGVQLSAADLYGAQSLGEVAAAIKEAKAAAKERGQR